MFRSYPCLKLVEDKTSLRNLSRVFAILRNYLSQPSNARGREECEKKTSFKLDRYSLPKYRLRASRTRSTSLETTRFRDKSPLNFFPIFRTSFKIPIYSNLSRLSTNVFQYSPTSWFDDNSSESKLNSARVRSTRISHLFSFHPPPRFKHRLSILKFRSKPLNTTIRSFFQDNSLKGRRFLPIDLSDGRIIGLIRKRIQNENFYGSFVSRY